MIVSFKDRHSRSVFEGRFVKTLPPDIQPRARRKLLAIDAAIGLDVLRSLPGNHLEALAGDRAGRYSIRVNDQWRICFRWQDGDAAEVEIVDYHRG